MTGVADRIDYYPTHDIGGCRVRPGRPMPFGATLVPGGVNFSIFSNEATACTLALFRKRTDAPFAEILIPPEFRVGNTWSVMVFDLDYEEIEYGYRFAGPWQPEQGRRFYLPRSSPILTPRRSAGATSGWPNPIGQSPIPTARGLCSRTSTGRTTAFWNCPPRIW